jgi:hypothetical protein
LEDRLSFKIQIERAPEPLVIRVDRTWDGVPIPPQEQARVTLTPALGALRLAVDAPFYNDPKPPGPAASCWGLWEYEAVELFLLGDDERYIEIELGPHGHWLGLQLHNRRDIVERDLEFSHTPIIQAGRWRSETSLPRAWLPPGVRAFNAYCVHGQGPKRRYLAAHPVPGDKPDFHRLERFAPLPHALLKDLAGG